MTERIGLLDDLGAEFARVAGEAERASRAPRPRPSRAGLRARTFAIALSVVALLAGGAYTVPSTRAAVDGIADSFADWVAGDDDEAPGRPVGSARLIAESGGVGLYAKRVASPEGLALQFGLGHGPALAMTDSLEGWRERLARHAIFVLGYTPFRPRDVLDDRGRAPLLGVTARDVERVELRYLEGPPLASPTGDGGFVLLVEAWRPLRELIAYDGAGRVLERSGLSELDLRYLCEKDPGACPGPMTSAP